MVRVIDKMLRTKVPLTAPQVFATFHFADFGDAAVAHMHTPSTR